MSITSVSEISLKSVQSVFIKNRPQIFEISRPELVSCLEGLCRDFKSPFKGDLEGLGLTP